MSPRRSGTVPSTVSGPDQREHISRRSGEANTQDLAWGVGTPKNGQRAGKHNAVWAFVNVSGGAGNYNILHALRSIPVAVELVEVRFPSGAAAPHVTIQPIRQSEWTTTVVRVNINVVAGALTGCTAVFLVRGA